MPIQTGTCISERLSQLPWDTILTSLDSQGYARTGSFLSPEECTGLAALYSTSPQSFRSRVIMQRHAFGKGEYQYFSYPLPGLIDEIRHFVYPKLAPVANQWQSLMGKESRFPEDLDDFLTECHQAGQNRPTPLLLKYVENDYNCLHQDLYGEHFFPIQMTLQLSDPNQDFTGGEFVLVEQRPRMQSKPSVIPLRQGEALIFCVNQRPVRGSKGYYRVTMRHGVSALRSGQRFSAGIIFHDAR